MVGLKSSRRIQLPASSIREKGRKTKATSTGRSIIVLGVGLPLALALFLVVLSGNEINNTSVLDGMKNEPQSVQKIRKETQGISTSSGSGDVGGSRPKVERGDENCPFRDSPIYRKVFVYPNHGDVENGWEGDILSDAGKNPSLPRWPFLDFDISARENATGHYNVRGQNVQYTTELLVREIMVNPKSCLRTHDPEQATLFYVPYLPSIEHHMGTEHKLDYSTSKYAAAIQKIIDDGDHTDWENVFGLTSKYWKRRGGSDHILVFSEPIHGLTHPRSKRGNYHYIRTQKQLKSPIVISVELSTTFVKMYPKCSAKNILVPYPNTYGSWFNGEFANEAKTLLSGNHKLVVNMSLAALPAERQLSVKSSTARPIAQFYSAGAHGTCTKLRRSMKHDYGCTPNAGLMKSFVGGNFAVGMQLATFCPCPGGDSPSAKRHFDALFAGCIPIIISYDFVWPFTNEFDPNIQLDPSEFSLRLNAQDYNDPLLDGKTCVPLNSTRPGMQAFLDSISASELERLRYGAEKARELYAWYRFDPSVPMNPLREGYLPDGGAAHQVVKMLAERASGAMWPACEEEMKGPRDDPVVSKFIC